MTVSCDSCYMKRILCLVCLVPVVLICGCTSISKIVKEAAKDPAAIKIRATGFGVIIEVDRSFPTNWVPPALPR